MRLKLPPKVTYILDILRRHGFEAYAVGGCVRDSILAKEPNDWDITTSARPEEVKACFRRTVDTGIQHGTVTVMLEEDAYEVTTYRIDGNYSDGRHPDSVSFTGNLADDLMRRDFTVNAMAYNDTDGLMDLHGGMQDLQRRVIRCVGDPDERFSEDALRVMRAVRFAAQLGFRIDEGTRSAIRRHAKDLSLVSAERIRDELLKLLISPHPEMFGDLYELGITAVILPEFDICMETEQNTPHHMYTVGVHTIKSMCEIPNEKVLRLAMLFHDIAKPEMKYTDSRGRDRFQGHAVPGAKKTDEIMRRLKFDNETRKKVVNLVRWHDLRPKPVPSEVRRAMYAVGPDCFEDYLAVQWADARAKSEYRQEEKQRRIHDVYAIYKEIVKNGDCLSLSELAVNGNDLIALGVRGREVGELLEEALMAVLEDPSLNTKEFLLSFCRTRYHLHSQP